MKILLLEDDAQLSSWIADGLQQAGHVVDALSNGREALSAATTYDYDVLILDRMVPELDGVSVLKALRAAKITTPALFLSAMGDVDDRVDGFEAGGDDYLVKPFALVELQARLTAIARRNSSFEEPESTTLQGKDIELDLLKQVCKRQGEVVTLNTKEFRLLEALMRHKNRVMTKAMLLERVWNLDFDPTTSVVESHMSRLRSKIEKPFGDTVITTVRGSGYRFDD